MQICKFSLHHHLIHRMDEHWANIIVIAFFQVILASRILIGVFAELQQQELRRITRYTIKKRSREDDELALAGAFACQQKRMRRFWVDA